MNYYILSQNFDDRLEKIFKGKLLQYKLLFSS